jgi:putative endonuclease
MTKSPALKQKAQTSWHVYMVRCADDTLYTGVSTNVTDRVATHNSGRGAKYTRARLPVTLVYCEIAPDRSTAQQREHEIKKLPVVKKQELITRGGGQAPFPLTGGCAPGPRV